MISYIKTNFTSESSLVLQKQKFLNKKVLKLQLTTLLIYVIKEKFGSFDWLDEN